MSPNEKGDYLYGGDGPCVQDAVNCAWGSENTSDWSPDACGVTNAEYDFTNALGNRLASFYNIPDVGYNAGCREVSAAGYAAREYGRLLLPSALNFYNIARSGASLFWPVGSTLDLLEAANGRDAFIGTAVSDSDRAFKAGFAVAGFIPAERLLPAATRAALPPSKWADAVLSGHLTPEAIEAFGSHGSVILSRADFFSPFAKDWGRPTGQVFVTTREAGISIQRTAGSLAEVNRRLGTQIAPGTTELVHVLITDWTALNPRLPTRGNVWWRLGGLTFGGLPEVIIDPVNLTRYPLSNFTVR